MALTKEDEVLRLVLLGGISQLEEHERDEIHQLKKSLLEMCDATSKKELAQTAVALLALELQKEE